jgi:hypothetical protein
MLPAKDRSILSTASRQSARLCCVGLALVSLIGCSQIRGFRRSESPKVGGAIQGASDPYLAAHAAPHPEKATVPAGPDLDVGPRDALVKGEDSPLDLKDSLRSTAHPLPKPLVEGASGAEPSFAVRLEPPITAPSESAPIPRGATPAPVVRQSEDAKTIIAKSRAKLNALTSYRVELNRQERVGGTLQPPEDVTLSIRRDPKAVRLEWPSGPHKGREVLYSANDPSGMMHVNAADSLVPVPRLALPPNGPLVMRNSRHPITEAGFDTILANIESHLASNDRNAKNSYEGIETPKAVGHPCYKLTRVAADGERWLVYIDTKTAFPAMVEATNHKGELLERYLFRDVATNPTDLASNDAFDPEKRWGSSAGFLGRLARSAGGDASQTANPTRR